MKVLPDSLHRAQPPVALLRRTTVPQKKTRQFTQTQIEFREWMQERMMEFSTQGVRGADGMRFAAAEWKEKMSGSHDADEVESK